MRKEYYNYVVKLPVLLHELFRGKVAEDVQSSGYH